MFVPLAIKNFHLREPHKWVGWFDCPRQALKSVMDTENQIAFFSMPNPEAKEWDDLRDDHINQIARLGLGITGIKNRQPIAMSCDLHCDHEQYSVIMRQNTGTAFLTPRDNEAFLARFPKIPEVYEMASAAYYDGRLQLWRTPPKHGVVVAGNVILHTAPFPERTLREGESLPHDNVAVLRIA